MFSFRLRSGFTLIELLCVIAIIALLSAILFPVFARARGMARRSVCQSNLKQIGLAMTQYVQDYDEMLPMRAILSGPNACNWQNIIQPYTKSYQVFECPGNPFRDQQLYNDPKGLARLSYAPNTKRSISNVGDNGGLFFYNDNVTYAQNATPLHLAAVTNPSTTIAFLETNGAASDFIVTHAHFGSIGNCNQKPCLGSAHLGLGNYLFADGHVKALKPEKTLAPVNMWHRDNIPFEGYELEWGEYITRYSSVFYHNAGN